jgi:hypothetical protein
MVNTRANRRRDDRGNEPGLAVEADDRRQHHRRRGDARTIDETVANLPATIVRTVAVGGSVERKSAVFTCGCIAVEPAAPTGTLQLLECPTHAALQAKLRRRQTDRH